MDKEEIIKTIFEKYGFDWHNDLRYIGLEIWESAKNEFKKEI